MRNTAKNIFLTLPRNTAVWCHVERWFAVALALLLASTTGATPATWNSPDFDTWTYPSAGSPGQRALGPTFFTSPRLDENNQFKPSTSRDPARRGMTVAAFDTSTDIQPGLDSLRYVVNSVTATFTMQFGTAGDVLYDDTPDTNTEFLDDYVTGNIDTARPMELYGVAFQAGYTGFDFAQNPGVQPFGENTYPYSPSDSTGVLVTYPIASNASGLPVDISNSLTGGYSATAPGNVTDPFDPTPWSIGVAAGLNPGDVIPPDTTFSFSLDLGLPGVTEYVQQALADGALGFVLSSPHFTGDPHNGTVIPYPQWYLKEFPTGFGGVPPTLAVDFSLLPAPGDFEGDEDVDAADLAQWEGDFGVNAGSDADGDGDSDGADFLVWQQNFSGEPAGLAATASIVPEPNAVALVLVLMVLIVIGGSGRKSGNAETRGTQRKDATPACKTAAFLRLSTNQGPLRFAGQRRDRVS